MDPLTALGLASNIIQLIQFTSDLVSKGREIYNSADGSLVENLELETIAQSLQNLSIDILPSHSSRTDKQLVDLCKKCNEISQELVKAITAVKANGPDKKWDSFRQALSSVWNQKAIDALSARMERYRSQLDTTLLVSLREKLESEDRTRLIFPQGLTRINAEAKKPWHAELIETLKQNDWQAKSQQDRIAFSSRLSDYSKDDREQLCKAHILEQLVFGDMGDRYKRIEEAHQRTFNWIFQEGRDGDFVKWLSNDEDLYWITGKPGSGKSTLHNLMRWSGSKPLVTAGFFFWNSGTVMQMSKMGLLQALLHDLFIIRRVSELLLFIDGLDEFDGDCTKLASFVLEHSARPNVKICAASRPWLVFEVAFKQRPSLKLEDLTASDIMLFVGERLRGHSMFNHLESIQPQEAKNLIAEVTGKASGVFLWVRLVISSLLEGLRDGDNMKDLQKRLYSLPGDLEELFSKILNQLSSSYFEQASKLFQLVRAAGETLSLLSLSFAVDGLDEAIDAEVEPLSSLEKNTGQKG
ncbi:uncharacterized protein LY89DRAFT_699451 [Mollisia scopiformis]|uniref:Nephrocystin 3-like N-terminal domain-containing protein n=1 Tax=Mollisia scopiformis TaxID=149040 RepID=A0A194WXY7_MOLSC|nr:uncharacterized protein LY89DRAFT_699451 [Mollisia scopiformis]KUJ12838.1 hypothetical protein LY89DRAFT_699451 [Mollisia scopiformis]